MNFPINWGSPLQQHLNTWSLHQMQNIKALPFFSINKRLPIKICLLLISVFASTPSYTCGPEYDSLGIDMVSSMGFEPRVPSTKDVDFLWYDLVTVPYYRARSEVSGIDKPEKEEIAEFNKRINSSFLSAGRKLKIPEGIEVHQVNKNPEITMVEISFPGKSYNWGICASNNR